MWFKQLHFYNNHKKCFALLKVDPPQCNFNIQQNTSHWHSVFSKRILFNHSKTALPGGIIKAGWFLQNSPWLGWVCIICGLDFFEYTNKQTLHHITAISQFLNLHIMQRLSRQKPIQGETRFSSLVNKRFDMNTNFTCCIHVCSLINQYFIVFLGTPIYFIIKRVVERQVISEFQPLGRNLDKTQPSWLIVCSEIERSR